MADQGETAQGTHEEEGGAESGDAPAPTDGQPAAPVEDVEPEIVEDPVSMEKLAVQLKIASAFRLFDHENTNSVDVRELGTIIRSLGCCPSETDLNDMIMECEEEEQTGFIKYDRFEPMMARVLLAQRYQSKTEDEILRAFKVLDPDGKGFLTEEELMKYLTEEGEPFSAEEVAEMMSAAKDVEKGVVYYDDHAMLMTLEEEL